MIPSLFLFFTEPISPTGRVAFITMPLGIYMFLLSLSRRPGIVIWSLFPLIVLGAFQLVLLYLFGNSIIAVDMFLNVVTTNPNEVGELLGKLLPSIVGVILLYVPTLALGILSIRVGRLLPRAFRHRYRVWGLGIFALGLVFAVISRLDDKDYRIKLDVWPANILYNIKLAVDKFDKDQAYARTSKGFSFGAVSTHPDSLREVYVMVVGETARAINFGLYGYERNTNPKLSGEERLVFMRDMLTQANATHKSVPMIMSAASAENFDTIYRQKSIITAFKEAGFRTVFVSNQRRNGSFTDFFADEAHLSIFTKDGMAPDFNPHDRDMLNLLDEELARDERKLFVVLHAYGSHFDYQGRYDERDRRFTPDKFDAVKKRYRAVMLNSYDNSLVATDDFLHGIIHRLNMLDSAASAMIYVSDHGEDLLDDRRRLFLHASPLPSYYQLHVPGIVWVSEEYDNAFPEMLPAVRGNKCKPMTTNVVFHSMLQVGGIETPWRHDSLSMASPRFTVTERYYLTDHYKPIAIDKLGLGKWDERMFQKEGVMYHFDPKRQNQ